MNRWDLNELLETINSDSSETKQSEYFEPMNSTDRLLCKPTKLLGNISPRRLKEWLTEIENYCESYVPDQSEWLWTAKVFMTAEPYYWYKSWNPSNVARPWDDFEAAIKKHFLPKGFETAAILKLDTIKCQSSAARYNVEFQNLIRDVPFPFSHPDALVFRYKRGLPNKMREAIGREEHQSLNDLMLRAQVWEQNDDEPPRSDRRRSSNREYDYDFMTGDRQESSNYRKNNRSRNDTQQFRRNTRRTYDDYPPPEPMDLSTIRSKPLPPKERAWRIEEGLCFHCRTGYHHAHDCPSREEQKN